MIVSVNDLRELLLPIKARDVSDETLKRAADTFDEDMRELVLDILIQARAYNQLRPDMLWQQ